MNTDLALIKKYGLVLPILNENQRRIYLASEAECLGRGGYSKVSKLTGISRVTLMAGKKENSQFSQGSIALESDRIRKPGGGRKKKTILYENLTKVIEEIVSPHTMGDPMNPLLWTSKSLRNIASSVKEKGYDVSHKLVGNILKELGYSLQSNRKTDEGSNNIDRDAQFIYINSMVKDFITTSSPVISVDCKKKELIGNFKNAGVEWQPKNDPIKVKVYDFIDKGLGKAIPYGVYDVSNNQGWVSVGISSDTATFAVSSIRNWWHEMGKQNFPKADKILITADGGGSNSSRSKLWKIELEKLATELDIEISVCHYPPGTSKWNKIEHRLFSYISMNWRARPLTSLKVIVDLISSTKTVNGLVVKAKLDENIYETGIKIPDEEINKINIIRCDFHKEWNYTIKPKK